MLMRSLLLALLLGTSAFAQSVVWNVAVPDHWENVPVTPPQETLVMQLFPKDQAHQSSVLVRHYRQEQPSLADELRQLRYSVVIKLEGKILSQAPCQVAGQPGLKVVYEGRSSRGGFKRFVRYMTIYRGELLTVHCVPSPAVAADEADFKSIVDGITVSVVEEGPQ